MKYDVVDVTDFESVNKTVKNLKNSKIDILINNAGITGPTAELWNYSVDDWNKVINVNLNGTYICCKLISKIIRVKIVKAYFIILVIIIFKEQIYHYTFIS